jgi:hypothetical protein
VTNAAVLAAAGREVVFLVVTRHKQQLSGRKLCYAHEWEQGGISATTIP